MASPMTNDTRVPTPALFAGFVILLIGGAITLACVQPWTLFQPGRSLALWAGLSATAAIAWLVTSSIKVAQEWERAVVLRLGAFQSLRGPGTFFILPVLETISHHVDQRVRARRFGAETTLTKDTVPVDVDAIFFYLVWDVKKAVLEVEEYNEAIFFAAQTALRDIIGKNELSEILQNRKELGASLQEILDGKTHDWGITITSVEIRDIRIPRELEHAMSKEAQAERERRARIILGTAETEISEKFAKAAECYKRDPVALHLRGMNMLFEGLKEKGSMIIVPSSALETMNLGSQLSLASLADNQNARNNSLPEQPIAPEAA